jgi:pimeloyl-ACP methyl ester carboxylesterase
MAPSINADHSTVASSMSSAIPHLREESFPIGDGSVSLNCALGGDDGAAPVLCFHGVTRCWQDFSPILDSLSRVGRLRALDHRGHGKSGRGGSLYRIADYVADALAFFDAHLAASTILLGHSLGAMVAAMVAAERPGQVRGLILEDPPGTSLAGGLHESKYFLQFTNTLELLEKRPGLSIDALRDELGAMPVQHPVDGRVVPFHELRDRAALQFSAECLSQLDPAVLRTLTAGRWLEGLDWFGRLPRVACPTLLLRADPACGGMLAEEEASRIASLIPRCTRVDLPGVGHGIHGLEPGQMLAVLARFLETHQLLAKKSLSLP